MQRQLVLWFAKRWLKTELTLFEEHENMVCFTPNIQNTNYAFKSKNPLYKKKYLFVHK